MSEKPYKHTNTVLPSPDEIMAAATDNMGWTKKQLAEWGVPWPPPKGWKRELEQRWHANKLHPKNE